MGKGNGVLRNLLEPLWQYVIGPILHLLRIGLNLLRLLLTQRHISRIVKDGGLLAPSYEHAFQIVEKLPDDEVHRLILEVVGRHCLPLAAGDGDGVGSGHNQSAELKDELLKAGVVELADLPLAQQLDVDVSDQRADLVGVGEEGQPIVLQQLHQLDRGEDLLPLLVVLELLVGVAVVHRPRVGQEQVPQHLVILLEGGLD
jgi:hypothetical protein